MKYHKHPLQLGAYPLTLFTPDVVDMEKELEDRNKYLSEQFQEVTPFEYYRDLFPEGSFELDGVEDQERRPNGLISVLEDADQPGRRYNRILFDDLKMLDEVMEKDFVVIAPIGYSGRRRLSKNAYCFFGMIIDLDDVGVENLEDLIYEMQNGIIPNSTFLVSSGTGIHCVFAFDNPIPALPQYFESMTKLKASLTEKIWNRYTSRDINKQFQGVFQAYRMVGTKTKMKTSRVKAFRTGKKVTLNYLNEFVEKENQCTFNDLKHTSLIEAKDKWPTWYERVTSGKPVGSYKLSDLGAEKEEIERKRRRAWYDAWIERIKKGCYDGNRFYSIGVLYSMAQKAEIPLEEVTNDALELVPYLNSLTKKKGNEFTESDVYCAQVYYDRKYIKMGRKGILKMTKIDIGETKRNHQSRKNHLEEARAIRDVRMKRIGKKWDEGNGRKPKCEEVKEWRKNHPNGTKAECIKGTGVSKPTVYKWWDA